MTFILGCILGYLAAVLLPLIRRETRPTQTTVTPDEESRRRTERALREYRNFMTYDGYAQQDDQT